MFIRHFKISSFSSNLAATALLQITHGKNRNLLQTGTERVMHVNFAWFYRLYPPRTEHWTLDANSWENDGNTFLSANLANAVLNVVILQFFYEYSLCRSLQRCPVVCVLFKNLMGRHASFSWPSNASRHKVFKYCQTVFKFKGGAVEHKVAAQIFFLNLDGIQVVVIKPHDFFWNLPGSILVNLDPRLSLSFSSLFVEVKFVLQVVTRPAATRVSLL